MIRPRGPAAKVAAAVAGTILLSSLGAVLYVRHRIDRRWSSMEVRCLQLRAEIEARGKQRPTLRSRPREGDARADYETAIRAAHLLQASGEEFPYALLFLGTGKGDPGTELAVSQYCTPVVAALRRGASRERFTRPLPPEPPLESFGADLTFGIPVVDAARFQADTLRELGHRREAAELLLDACLYSRDLGLPFTMQQALRGLSELLQDEQLLPEDSREIARELALLDSAYPRRAFEVDLELLRMGSHFVGTGGRWDDGLVVWRVPEEPVGWRHAWSLRLYLAEAFEDADRACRDLGRRDELPWTEACREWTSRSSTHDVNQNAVASHFNFINVPLDLYYRAFLAQVRVLRVAAHYRAGGETLDLADPFGSRIQTRKTGDRLRVSSVGDIGTPEPYKSLEPLDRTFNFHPKQDGVNREIDLEVPR